MVHEEKEKIILDNNVAVDPISRISCPKCKTNLDHSELCENCKKNQYPFKSVIALGYYFPRWARKRDTMISPDVRKYRLNNINPEYLFSELINYAKGRSKKSKTKRLEIIKILCKGLAWKLKKDCFNILKKISIILFIYNINKQFIIKI